MEAEQSAPAPEDAASAAQTPAPQGQPTPAEPSYDDDYEQAAVHEEPPAEPSTEPTTQPAETPAASPPAESAPTPGYEASQQGTVQSPPQDAYSADFEAPTNAD